MSLLDYRAGADERHPSLHVPGMDSMVSYGACRFRAPAGMTRGGGADPLFAQDQPAGLAGETHAVSTVIVRSTRPRYNPA